MNLIEHRDEGALAVRWVRADAVGIGSREFRRSFLLSPEALIEDWPPTCLEQIDETATASILKLQPAVVLLGTGPTQILATPELQARFLTCGIGVECMTSSAAARTYNLLAGEGRRVVAAFLLPD